jgi:hypothetical protein
MYLPDVSIFRSLFSQGARPIADALGLIRTQMSAVGVTFFTGKNYTRSRHERSLGTVASFVFGKAAKMITGSRSSVSGEAPTMLHLCSTTF